MPDIALRFHKDMLVVTDPVETLLARQGIDFDNDFAMTILLEQDSIEDAYRVQKASMAQCVVAPTAHLTPARLAHVNMVDRLEELAGAALETAQSAKPQHLLVELGPCGLPLDGSSKTSLKENRDQYARAARAFHGCGRPFDGFLLSGFENTTLLKCALMGIRMSSDAPIIACVNVDAEGYMPGHRESIEDAIAVMAEYGASVVGYQTPAGPEDVVALAARVVNACNLPVMACIEVKAGKPRQDWPTPDAPYFNANQMFDVALRLRAAGAQFVRAAGDATPAYTGGMAACLAGLYVVDVRGILNED